jgi:hypothetical protein
MKAQVITIGICAALLAGCQQASTESGVAQAQVDAAENTREARVDAAAEIANADERVDDAEQAYARADAVASNALTRAESDAMIKTANANFDVARTTAVGYYDIEKEKCDALTGVVKDACISTADATFTASELAAISTRDAALVAAEFHE